MTAQPATALPFKDLPEGTVTFLFSDIEASTQLLYRLGEQFTAVVAEHHRIVREAVASSGGHIVRTEGDSFFVAFPRATSAVSAAVEAQRSLARHTWPEGAAVRVRMGLHTGEPEVALDDYVGLAVHRAARIASVGHGGQVLLSETTTALARDELPQGVTLLDLGAHLLRDLRRPERICQLCIEGLPSAFPPLLTLGIQPHGLPLQLTNFIGREAELAQMRRLLEDPAVRLVTVVGLGGMGKTRLALEAAAAQVDRFEEGVHFVPLAPIQSADDLAPAIAQALRLSLRVGPDPGQQILDFLHERQILLLLDNFEHVLDGAGLVTAILEAAPKVKVLATSRLRLKVPGEQIFHLSGMNMAEGEIPSDALQSSVVRLFLQGARRVRPGFELVADEVRHVAAICQVVDGMPLGLLLAAAWVEMLSPAEIVAEMQSALDLLDAAGSKGSIRAVLDYSWSQLNPAEREAFGGLSVFRGGFVREAAQAVTGATLRELLGLVNKSLLSRAATDRYELHELVRQAAAEKLDQTGQAEHVRRRHLEYYLSLAQQFEQEWSGPHQAAWLLRLAAEIENLRAALSWSITAGRPQTGLRLALALFWFWRNSGYHRESRDWLARLLAEAPEPSADRVRAFRCLAALADDAGDDTVEMARREEALAAAEALGDPAAIVYTANRLALRLFSLGDVGRARQLAERSIALIQDRGELRAEAAHAVMLMGELARNEGDLLRAKDLHERALAMYDSLNTPKATAYVLSEMGDKAQIRGDLGRAQELHEKSTAMFRCLDDRSALGVELSNLGCALTPLGDLERSRAVLTESLSILLELKSGTAVFPLMGLGILAHAQGQPGRAVRVLGAADALRRPMGWGVNACLRREYDAALSSLRLELGEAAFTSAWREGQALSLPQAAALAMSNEP